VPDPGFLVPAHVGHWIWQLLIMAPLLLLAVALLVAEIMDRRNPGKYERQAEEQAERELDEILSG
jgi:hypothetical protein